MRAKEHRAMKVVWLSANKLGYALLKETLRIKGIDIVEIVTLHRLAPTRMCDAIQRKKWYAFHIPVREIVDINKEQVHLTKLHPDYIVVVGWRQIIRKNIMRIPKKGCIGFHPTLLPKGRGYAPIINSILEGYSGSGVTMFYIDEQIDHGDIIGQEPFVIEKNDHADDVYKKVTKSGRILIRKYLPLIKNGTAPRIKQKDKDATYFQKRTIADNEIMKGDSLDVIHRKIRAFSSPYMGAYIKKKNKKFILWKAALEDTHE